LRTLQRHEYMKNYTDLTKVHANHVDALSLLESYSLDDWHETRQSEVTKLMVEYRSRVLDLLVDSDELVEAVQRWLAIHEPTQDPIALDWMSARFSKASPAYLDRLVPDSDRRSHLNRVFDKVVISGPVKKAASAYRGAVSRCDRQKEVLLPALIAEMRSISPSQREVQARK
jgi:hypothetical protein